MSPVTSAENRQATNSHVGERERQPAEQAGKRSALTDVNLVRAWAGNPLLTPPPHPFPDWREANSGTQ